MENTVSYQLTQRELYKALQLTLRKAGNRRLIFQAVVLAVVGAISLIEYFAALPPRPTVRLGIGIAALILIPIQWLLPNWRFHSLAKEMAHRGETIYLTFQQDGITVGKNEQTKTLSLDECRENLKIYLKQQLAILQVDQYQWIPIPRRVLPPADWDTLLVIAEAAGSQELKYRM